MNDDLISRKYVVRELLKEREHYPPMVAERYSFGVKLPHHFNQAMRGGIRKALRIAETAPAIDAVQVVRCKYCIHLTRSPWNRVDMGWCKLYGHNRKMDYYCASGEQEVKRDE